MLPRPPIFSFNPSRPSRHTRRDTGRPVRAGRGVLPRPRRPQTPQDLTAHSCINLRLPTHGGLYAWEFEKDGREVKVRVDGQLTFNAIDPVVNAALEGYGLGYVPEGLVSQHIEAGRLTAVLDDWSPPFPGYYLYYPHRRQSSSAFAVILEAMRHKS